VDLSFKVFLGGGRMAGEDVRRVSLNIRVDPEKHASLEQLRKTGFGMATTERNRSDIYNEVLGYGLQTIMLKQDIGDRDFEKVWKLLHNINWKKINLESWAKLTAQ
jgi:hypothetical protein